MHSSIQRLLAAAVLVVTVACQKDSTPIKTEGTGETTVSAPADSANARGHSLVRVVNAVAAGADASVYLDNVEMFGSVKSGTVTEYREIATNLAKFSVRTPGDTSGMQLAEKDRILLDGNRYTVFLIKQDVSKNTLRVVKDDVIPDSGKARIRIVHAAPGGPEFDVAVVGSTEKLFTGINFTSEAGFRDVTPGKFTLELHAKGTPKLLLTIPGVDLKRATATTIVVTGSSKLGFFKFEDAMMAKTPKA